MSRAATGPRRPCAVNKPPCAGPASAQACCAAPPTATNRHGPGFPAATSAHAGNQQGPTGCTPQRRLGSQGFPSAKPRRPKQAGPLGCFANPCQPPQQFRQAEHTPVLHATRAGRQPGETTRESAASRKATGLTKERPTNANAPTDKQPEGRCAWSRGLRSARVKIRRA